MSFSRDLTADRQPLEVFKGNASKTATNQPTPTETGLDLFEWCETGGHDNERRNLESVKDLKSKSEGIVRVILAPRDIFTPGRTESLAELFETCSIPSAFIDESLRAVSQSFAAREDMDGTMCIWFHLLCKTLAVMENDSAQSQASAKVDDNEGEGLNAARAQSQADFSWIKPGVVLKIRKRSKILPELKRTSTSDSKNTLTATPGSDDTTIDIPVRTKVELVCFGPPSTLRDRLQVLARTTKCDDLLDDPYILLEILFEEMFKVLDCTAWAVSDRFGPLETQTLGMASQPGKATERLPKDHFTGLHNLAKHTIYLRENCEAALATLDNLYSHHKTTMDKDANASQRHTSEALEYRKTLFESTQRRLASLNARISNIIQLSFHIVTQGDSKMMQSESQSMKTIAIMTLLFLPLGTVASIFGSQFMKLHDERPYHITVSQDFWMLWVIAVPLTIVVMTIWWVCYMDAKARLLDGVEKGGYCYMVLKTVSRMLRRVKAKKGKSDA